MMYTKDERNSNMTMVCAERAHIKENSFYIISRIAYLAGVPKKIFDNDAEPPQKEVFVQLQQDKNARIIRNLCILRTAIEQNYCEIQSRFTYDFKNIHTIPDLIPMECIDQLYADGISIVQANHALNRYIIDINRHIVDRINNCRAIFPNWIPWDYVRALFVMPKGLTETGIKAAAKAYYANQSGCPYQVYLNWPYARCGNLLYNDKKFVTLLYEVNGDHFEDFSKVTDADAATQESIYQFLTESQKVCMVVDCENSDPYKLYAALNHLDQYQLLDKVSKIILYDDVHTGSGWGILERFTKVPTEHLLIQRVKESKSLVDISLTAGICREFYQNDVDSFLLVSSDSDFWGLIASLTDTRFFVMVESRKCGPDIKLALRSAGIPYCYLDDFCTGNSDHFKTEVMLSGIKDIIESNVHLNVYDMLENTFRTTRINMTDGEKKQFFNRYLKTIHIKLSENGDIKISLGA